MEEVVLTQTQWEMQPGWRGNLGPPKVVLV